MHKGLDVRMIAEFTDAGDRNTYSIYDNGNIVEVVVPLFNYDKRDNSIVIEGTDFQNLITDYKQIINQFPEFFPRVGRVYTWEDILKEKLEIESKLF